MTEDKFKKILNTELASFYGQITRHVDTQISELRVEMNGRFDHLTTMVDGIARHLDNDATEQTIVNARHEGWIKQIAENTGTKLVPEL